MRRFAKGRPRPTPGAMNKTEVEYAAHLGELLIAGDILGWWFEPVTLRLAKLTTYRPDFLVMHTSGLLEFREVKGHWEDDARAKIKIAAELHWMFVFTAVTKRRKKDGGGWAVERFGYQDESEGVA